MQLDIEKLMADTKSLIQYLEGEVAMYKLLYVLMHALKDDADFIKDPETVTKLMGLRGIIDKFQQLKADEEAKRQ